MRAMKRIETTIAFNIAAPKNQLFGSQIRFWRTTGHGLGVSLEVYTMSDLEQKIEAVTQLETAVIN
jgi:hypothetical protein